MAPESITTNGTNIPTGIKGIFRALKSRNFRLFFGGQGISLIGTWMQMVAQSWLVYRLTGSPTLLGVVGFAANIPSFVLAPFAGVLADRFNRHRMLVITQVLSMIQALLLAFLVLSDLVAVWHIIALALFLGIINAFDMPIRQSFIFDMIDRKEDLGNAIALNSSLVQSSRLIGPSIAGILIAIVGEGVCFLVNGLSFIAVIAALLAMKVQPRAVSRASGSALHGLKEGFRYAFGNTPIRSILILLALVNIVGTPYTVLMPIFARDILGGGPHTLGFIMTAVGIGALVGAIFLASRRSPRGLGKVLGWAAGIFGVGLVFFSLSRQVWLSLFVMLFTGFGMLVNLAGSNTVLQTIADEDKRGRVMSLYTMGMRGMMPFGSLLAGSVAAAFGAPFVLLLGGASCAVGAVIYGFSIRAMRQTSAKIEVFETPTLLRRHRG